jgi:serine/threonine protein kinase
MTYDEDFISYICYHNIHALNFLHKRMIVHRDIKSDNILYNYKGDVKLADFGLSISLTTEKATIKDTMGTMLYMAPELCAEKDHGCGIDIWSFGIMCVEMGNMMRPHEDENPFPEEPK